MITSSSPELRRHIYPDRFYGETPRLGGAAGDLARLLVKLGVDARGPQDDRASMSEFLAGLPRLMAMHRAAKATGFRVGVRLNQPDGARAVRVEYTQQIGRVGLLIADRPPLSSVRTLDMHWTLNDDTMYEPHASSGQNEEPFGPGKYDHRCATLWSQIMHVGSDAPLEVGYARLNAYNQPTTLTPGIIRAATP